MSRPGFIFGPRWIGSFQDHRGLFRADTALEEAWRHIARYATDLYLNQQLPANSSINWQAHIDYVRVRIQQALEFRAAAHSATLLTAPLPLYYALLNLVRAYLALVPEIMPEPKHGLHFTKSTDLLSCEARLEKTGTFNDYLTQNAIAWKAGDTISLRESLACIIEMKDDIESLKITKSHAQAVFVDARQGGFMALEFPGYPGNFATTWNLDFPGLVAHFHHQGSDAELVANAGTVDNTYQSVSRFLEPNLLNDLLFRDDAVWWAYRLSEVALKLDRLSYYYVACFILGSAVRYEPELVLAVSGSDSGVGWLLKTFIGRAERFFPQLLLAKMWGSQVYFAST